MYCNLVRRGYIADKDLLHRYWLDQQTPNEPFVFVMYDTKAGMHARCTLLLNFFLTVEYRDI